MAQYNVAYKALRLLAGWCGRDLVDDELTSTHIVIGDLEEVVAETVKEHVVIGAKHEIPAYCLYQAAIHPTHQTN